MAANLSGARTEAAGASFVWASAVDSPEAATIRTAPASKCLYMRHLGCRIELQACWVFLQGWLDLPVPLPNGIDRWVDHKFHQERRDDATHHGCGDSLHHIGTASRRPHERQQAEQHTSHGHDLGTKPLDGAVHDGLAQVVPIAHFAFADGIVIGEVQIEQHEDGGFGVDAEQSDQTHPHSDAHVVVQQVENPDRADGRERNCGQDDGGLRDRTGIEVQQQKDDEQRDGEHDLQPLFHPLHRLILTAPYELVAGRNANLLCNYPLCLFDVAAYVAAGDIHVDVAAETPILITDHAGSGLNRDVGDLSHRYLSAGRSGDQHAP